MGLVNRNACQSLQRISKATVLALAGSPINDPVPNNPLNPAVIPRKPFLLRTIPLDHWEVMSFNPVKREVCVLLHQYDQYGQKTREYRVMTIMIPDVTFTPKS